MFTLRAHGESRISVLWKGLPGEVHGFRSHEAVSFVIESTHAESP